MRGRCLLVDNICVKMMLLLVRVEEFSMFPSINKLQALVNTAIGFFGASFGKQTSIDELVSGNSNRFEMSTPTSSPLNLFHGAETLRKFTSCLFT